MSETEPSTLLLQALTRRQLLNRAGAGGALLAAPALLAACDTGGSDDGSPAGGREIDTLTWSFNIPATTLDPMKAGDLSSESAISNSVQGLVVYDAKGVIRPYLAKAFEQTDPKTYVFEMRKGVKFWDGTTMTMEDVLYWMDKIMKDKQSIFVSYFADVTSVEQTGDMQMTVTLEAPSTTFLGLANFLFVGQKKYTVANEKDLGTPKALGMYTGPYELEEYVPEESVTLTRFDGYWGSRPAAQRISYRFIPDDETRRLALQSEEIDGGFNVPPEDVDEWERLETAGVISSPNLQFGYISFDVKQQPWSNLHVRRAVAHAIDRAGIVKSVMRRNATVATTYPPPQDWTALLSPSEVSAAYAKVRQYEFDLDKAKAELAQSSTPDGFEATLQVPPVPAYLRQIGLTLSENLKQIGIDLEVKEVKDEVYREWYTDKKNTGIQLIQNGPTVQDPGDFPGIMLTKRYNVSGGFNTANYVNEKVEELWATQQSAAPEERVAPIMEVLAIAAEDVPYAPIFWNKGSLGISDRLSYDGFHAAWYVIQPWAEYIKPAASA
jgi:peptide/nickel transport system substrate-binding protein